MPLAKKGQLDGLAASLDDHLVVKAFGGRDAVDLRGRIGVRDHLCPNCKGRPARGVIEMAVRVDQVRDRLVEAVRDLVLEPPRRISVDRVSHDNAILRDDHHAEVELVLEPIDVALDLGKPALGVLRVGGGRQRNDGAANQSEPFDLLEHYMSSVVSPARPHGTYPFTRDSRSE